MLIQSQETTERGSSFHPTNYTEFLTAYMRKHGGDGGWHVIEVGCKDWQPLFFFVALHCLSITPTGLPCVFFSKVCCMSQIKAEQHVCLRSFHSSAINEMQWIDSRSWKSRTLIAVCVLAGLSFNPPVNSQLGRLVLNADTEMPTGLHCYTTTQDGGNSCHFGLKLKAEGISALEVKSNITENCVFELEVQIPITVWKISQQPTWVCAPSDDSWWTWWLWLRFPLTGSKNPNRAVTDVWRMAAHFLLITPLYWVLWSKDFPRAAVLRAQWNRRTNRKCRYDLKHLGTCRYLPIQVTPSLSFSWVNWHHFQHWWHWMLCERRCTISKYHTICATTDNVDGWSGKPRGDDHLSLQSQFYVPF